MIPINRIVTEQSIVCDICGIREAQCAITRGKLQNLLSKWGWKIRNGEVICPTCFNKPKLEGTCCLCKKPCADLVEFAGELYCKPCEEIADRAELN